MDHVLAVAFVSSLALLAATAPSRAQADMSGPHTAVDAALNMANMLDGAAGGVSSAAQLAALEGAAAADNGGTSQIIALWQLGMMYENGEGVPKDPVKAFGYFAQIARQHADDTLPHSPEADIVARSVVKMGDIYRNGFPDAGITADAQRSADWISYAANYFGNAEAQYRLGKLYQDEAALGDIPVLSARWLKYAADKGHAPAQAALGDMLFNGEGIEAQPVEGLMLLTIAHEATLGTADEAWISELLNRAMSVASPQQRAEAVRLAELRRG